MWHILGLTWQRVGAAALPDGEIVELPERGPAWVCDIPGPPGAPTLVLIHGLVATSYLNWFPAFAELSQRFRVVAMDLRGHGRGLRTDDRFRLADCADDVVAVADALGIDRFIVVGYSLGGPVAKLVWHRHRERVEGLVLCATSRNYGGTRRERAFFSLLYPVTAALRVFGRRGKPDEASVAGTLAAPGPDGYLSRWAIEELRATSPGVLLQAMHALGRFSSHEWIAEIDVPTAVVVTTKDRFIAAARQLKMARAIPGATVHPVDANHAACVLSWPRFVPALVEACESVAERLPVTLP